LGTAKNITLAAVALAFTGHIAWWMATGHEELEGVVAGTIAPELEREVAEARERSSCVPKHLVLESKTPDADALSPETLALVASRCEALGIAFHPEPPLEDLGCSPNRCGDCLGYAQKIRFNTPLVALARTDYFRGDVYQSSESYWYGWWLGSWHQVRAPKYRPE
jgi:hypothetical protein